MPEIPPKITLNEVVEILECCPWAIHLYYLLSKKNECNRLIVHLEDVEDEFYISPATLKEYLFNLAELGILTFGLKQDTIVIDIIIQDISAEGKTLC